MNRATAWRKAHPERAAEISSRSYFKRKAEGVPNPGAATQTKHRKTNPAKTLWRGAKDRATRKGIAFNIEPEDVVIPARCPIRDVPIVLEPFRHDDGPSIDRVKPHLGYTKGNIQVISMKANRMKSNGTLEDAIRLVEYLTTYSTVASALP